MVGLLPGLVMTAFVSVLPTILSRMCVLAGAICTYRVDFGVVAMSFWFQLLTVLLGNVVAGSLLAQLRAFLLDPSGFLALLPDGVTAASFFFVNYVLVSGVGMVGVRHLRLWALARYLLAKARASVDAACSTSMSTEVWYSGCVPSYTLAFALGLVFCCINPLICPAVLLYFSLALVSERYNHLYVYTQKHESGGELWVHLCEQFLAGLYVFQGVMILMFHADVYKAWALVPLPFLTLAFHITVRVLYVPIWSSIALRDAALLDANEPPLTESDVDDIRALYSPRSCS
jgi:hypothetical protein